MPALALILLLAGVSMLPEPIARVTGTSVRAWDAVAYAAEAGALWGVIWSWAPARFNRRQGAAVRVVAALGMLDAVARGGCRLLLPMDRAPAIGQQTMCQATLGDWGMWATLGAFFWGAAYVTQALRHGSPTSR